MKIYELVIEPGREEHIARHQVSIEEVEEVIFGVPFIRKARQERYHIVGQTEAGRYLTVFVAPRGKVFIVWSRPEMQMTQNAEHTNAKRNRDNHDKKRREAKSYKEPDTNLQDS